MRTRKARFRSVDPPTRQRFVRTGLGGQPSHFLQQGRRPGMPGKVVPGQLVPLGLLGLPPPFCLKIFRFPAVSPTAIPG